MAESILDNIFSGANGVAKTLINLMGGDATIYLPDGAGSYNPLNGTDTTGGLDAGTAIDLVALERVSEKDVDQSSILIGDFQALIAQSDVTLERSHVMTAEILFNDVRYKLVEYAPYHSGQSIAMYKIFMRVV